MEIILSVLVWRPPAVFPINKVFSIRRTGGAFTCRKRPMLTASLRVDCRNHATAAISTNKRPPGAAEESPTTRGGNDPPWYYLALPWGVSGQRESRKTHGMGVSPIPLIRVVVTHGMTFDPFSTGGWVTHGMTRLQNIPKLLLKKHVLAG